MDYEELSLAVQKGKAKIVKELVNKALEEGAPVKEILEKGLIAPMGIVGENFRDGKIFVPEMLVAARAMSAGVKIIEPLFSESGIETIGTVVIGTVKGVYNGCLCCNGTDELKSILSEVLADGKYDRIIIELSGMTRMMDFLRVLNNMLDKSDRADNVEIDHVTAVVDVKNFKQRVRISEIFMHNELKSVSQVYLSKTDITAQNEIEQVKDSILKINPKIQFITDFGHKNAKPLTFGIDSETFPYIS